MDFAKVDLEGHELPALKGWRKDLSEHKVRAIYIEIMPENRARYGRPTNAPLAFLESLGYELYLCKEDDFGSFGGAPGYKALPNGSLNSFSFQGEKSILKILQLMRWL